MMKKKYYLLMALVCLYSCGKIPDVSQVTSALTNPNTTTNTTTSAINAGPYTPRSYFKIMKDVGSGNDTRIYEFQYYADSSFVTLQRSFPGGNLSSGYYQKKTGTYSEDKSGNISHITLYDTCNDMTPSVVPASGDPNNIINVVWKNNNLSLYSYTTWTLPTSISSGIGTVVEDLGCKHF